MAVLEFDPALDFKLLLAAALIPLGLYLVQIFFGRRLPRQGDWLLTGGMFVSMAITVYLFAKALHHAGSPGEEHALFQWESVKHGQAFRWLYSSAPASENVVAGILYDSLGASMLMVVGVVSFFVHLFSTAYMQGDRRYHIFFANISLFTFAMLGLVLADNLLFLFVFWEIMGLMSYLLIGHFAQDPNSPRIRQASSACKKAFLTTRVGDVCLLVGIIIFYNHFHTFRFTELWRLAQEEVARHGGEYPAWMTVGGLFIFGGTVGKSAQFPLHIWLPDAMEGPTPVSAMIHAATMVAAGVFLLGRTYPLMSPTVLTVVTVVGAFTALFAATIGTTVFDIKGVLAYSTISQLGFMVAAVGLGGVVAGMFHMVTHAFFKACLFLCSGSVIHGCHHEQDMRRMGGLRKYMPVTFACMLISTLAIAGIPLLAGFYSKDKIIAAALGKTLAEFSGASLFAAIALPVAAALTAFYMFRLIFMTFLGEYRGNGDQGGHAHEGAQAEAGHDAHAHGDPAGHGDAHQDHGGHGHTPHESPWPMTAALSCLAALAIFGGHFWPTNLGDPLANHTPTWFARMVDLESLYGGTVAEPPLTPALEHIGHTAHLGAVGISLFVALAGIGLAWFFYMKRRDLPARIAASLGEVYRTVANKYYIDELIDRTAIRACVQLAQGLRQFDSLVVDGLVNLVGRTGRAGGWLAAWFDRTFVDGAVNGVALLTQTFGSLARLVQTGRVQQYATFAVFGGLVVAAWLILS
jgi:NADH-quinone oxidoreductase subunit L